MQAGSGGRGGANRLFASFKVREDVERVLGKRVGIVSRDTEGAHIAIHPDEFVERGRFNTPDSGEIWLTIGSARGRCGQVRLAVTCAGCRGRGVIQPLGVAADRRSYKQNGEPAHTCLSYRRSR